MASSIREAANEDARDVVPLKASPAKRIVKRTSKVECVEDSFNSVDDIKAFKCFERETISRAREPTPVLLSPPQWKRRTMEERGGGVETAISFQAK